MQRTRDEGDMIPRDKGEMSVNWPSSDFNFTTGFLSFSSNFVW